MARKSKAAQQARTEAIEALRGLLPHGARIGVVVTRVARSGMSRRMKLVIAQSDPEWPLRSITALVARALEYRYDDRAGEMLVGGCGMDMGFHVVNSLSYVIHGWPAPRAGDPPMPEGFRAGYTLRHEWL